MQVFGGSGYVEETGVAQYYRDVRIASIYEGTTAIQANDLLGRKFLRDSGKVALQVVARMQATVKELAASSNADSNAIGVELGKAVEALTTAATWLRTNAKKDTRQTFAAAVPYLMLWGYVAGGWQLGRSALVAEKKLDDPFYAAKLVTARFYADHVLPKAVGFAHEVTAGGATTMGLKDEQFEIDRKAMALV